MEYEEADIASGVWTVKDFHRAGTKNTVTNSLNALEINRRDEYDRLLGALEDFANNGPHPSKERFRKEGAGSHVLAIKAGQQRLYGFWDPGGRRKLFLAAAWDEKKKDRANQALLKSVEDLYLEYKAFLESKATPGKGAKR